MDASGPKRRKLNYDKCTFCRKAKQRCSPLNRQWPQKCKRCREMNLECSPSEDIRAKKPSSETADGGLSSNSGNDGNDESQMLRELQDWYEPAVKAHLHPLNEYRELELSWIRHHENYAARVQSITKAEDITPIAAIADLDSEVKWRKTLLLKWVSEFLDCPFPLVRQAALSIVSGLTSGCPAEAAGNDDSGFEHTLEALLQSLKSPDRINIELSVREYLLRAMLVRNACHQDMVDSVRAYSESCERYMLRVKQLGSGQLDAFGYDENILPFSGDTQMLSLSMQYSPDILFRFRDSIWNNALAATISSAEQKDIEQLFQNMEDVVFLELVVTYRIHNCTVLHTAAARRTNCVFDRLRALDRDKIESVIDHKDLHEMTPLSYAAANGSSTIVGVLLELGADPDVADIDERGALHHAARNGNEDIVRQLLLHDPGLCTRQDIYRFTPVHLAIKHGHHRVTKVFFSQPCKSLLENNEEVGAGIWMRLLELAFCCVYPQVVELLCYDQFVGHIDQTSSRQGQTSLSLAAEAGDLDAVKFLLSRGADARIADNNGETPCDLARVYGHHKVVSVLEGFSPPAVGQ